MDNILFEIAQEEERLKETNIKVVEETKRSTGKTNN